ncbi:unnamed protein product [Absidia cylindrospora]
MLGSITNSVSSPWALDDDATTAFNQPWSPALSASGHLPSPTVATTTMTTTTTMDNGFVSAVQQWDRFEPYGNDSEFDPTLTFYQGGDQANSLSTITSNHNSSNSISSSNSDNFNMMIVALRKLSLLFPDHDEKELEQTLAALDFDVEQTIEALSPESASATTTTNSNIPVLAATSISTAPTTATAEKVHLMKLPTMTSPNSTTISTNHINNNHNINNNEQQTAMLPNGTIRKRQVCRHYLAGECYRKDCWFAHDLEVKPCKFWLQGLCLKGDTCEFAHSLEELEQVTKNHHPSSSSSSPPSNNNNNNNNNNSHSSPTLNSHHHHHHHHQEQPLQHQPYTSPTVADFPILLARSKRKSKKKSHNKKIKS